jgi:ATP/maltotriose-dependent transcriptional regulator MalT
VLSRRELEVLLLAARAMSNSQIASRLHISEGTVKRHLTNIYAKLGVSSRADAAKKALTSGLITFRDLSEPNNQ